MIHVTLPFPPSTNHLYANTPNGRRMTEEGRAFKKECMDRMLEARIRTRAPSPPFVLRVWMLVPDKRMRDLSNLIKAAEDCLAEFLGYNDSLHHELHLYKALDRENPRCVLQLEHKIHRIPPPPDVGKPPRIPAGSDVLEEAKKLLCTCESVSTEEEMRWDAYCPVHFPDNPANKGNLGDNVIGAEITVNGERWKVVDVKPGYHQTT